MRAAPRRLKNLVYGDQVCGLSNRTMKNDDFLKRLKARNPRAQERLVRDFYPRMFAVSRRILRDDRRAEDLANDVISDFLFSYVDNLQSAAAIPAYLRMAVVRRAVRTRERLEKDAPIDTQGHSTPDVDDAIDQDRAKLRLRKCLEALQTRDRTLVRMRFDEGKTQDEIGAAFGFTKQYAGRALKRVLADLRACVERA